MRRDFLTDYILYLLTRAEAAFFRLLPLNLSLLIGRRFGDTAYYLIGKRKAVAYRNLRAAFRGKYNPAQSHTIIRKAYQNLAQSYIELLRFPIMGEDYFKKYITIEGDEKLKRALKEEGKGVIVLTAHFGNWELSSLAASIEGYKMNVLARWQKFERLNGYLNRMRSFRGANVIFKADAKEQILKVLNNNEVVGILSDQDGGSRGEFVEFFGRLASTPKGVAHFSLKTGAPIFPVFIVRQKGAYHKITVEEDISVLPSGDIAKDIHEVLQRFANALQSYIERYPDQWLWMHKRWKSTPTRYVSVLSDGKAGHTKQSLAIANMIKQLRLEQGNEPKDTIIETLEIRFKDKLARAIFDLGCLLGLSLHRLSFCFPEDVYNNIKSAYGDYIISCGASLAGLNLFLKKDLSAKSLVIMRPNIYNIKDYDLAVIPAHDGISRKPNVVITKGAVSDLDAEKLAGYAEQLKRRISITKKRLIGILLGGDSKAYITDPELVNDLLEAVLRAADEMDSEVLVTTSRRTSAPVESVVKSRLSNSERVKLLLIANENNFEGAIEGIMGLSDVLVVSGESIAMITEAVTSGKKVAVFMPRKRNPFLKTKQESAVRALERDKALVISNADRMKSDICSLIGQAGPQPFSADAEAVRRAIRKII